MPYRDEAGPLLREAAFFFVDSFQRQAFIGWTKLQICYCYADTTWNLEPLAQYRNNPAFACP